MDRPARHQWPAVVLTVLGLVLLVGTLLVGGVLLSGLTEPTNGHTVTQVDEGLCDSESPPAPQFDYADLSSEGQDVFDEALDSEESVRTRDRVDDFQYATPPPDNQVGIQYVRYEGDCYELEADAGSGAIGTVLLGAVLGITVVAGGGSGLFATVAGAVSYRYEPRLAPAVFVFLAGLFATALAWPLDVPLWLVTLAFAVACPVVVWRALTRRGWDELG